MSLAASVRRTPGEVEAMGFFDALALSAEISEQKTQEMKFEAALAGVQLR